MTGVQTCALPICGPVPVVLEEDAGVVVPGHGPGRICLSRSALFLAQLKALLRAGLHGNLRIMFPFISSLEELRAAKRAVRDAEEELRREGRNFKEGVPLGIMIEIPAAAVMSAELAKISLLF